MKKMFVLVLMFMVSLAAGVSQACEGTPVIMASAAHTFLNTISPPAATVPSITQARLQEIELVHVVGGCYSMGAGAKAWSGDTTPAHEVCVDDYYMGKYEVTQAQWRAVMGSNPSGMNSCGDNCPVVDVSWNEVQEFTSRLNELTGKNYRLPTEAEWEYAVSTGGTQAKNDAASGGSNHKRELRPVGWSQANALGIHDLQGSVWEWTSDRYNRDYYKKSAKNNPEGPTEGNYRVLRGGSWSDNPQSIQATLRMSYAPWIKRSFVGFRLLAPDQLSAKYRDPAIAPIENAQRNVSPEMHSKL